MEWIQWRDVVVVGCFVVAMVILIIGFRMRRRATFKRILRDEYDYSEAQIEKAVKDVGF